MYPREDIGWNAVVAEHAGSNAGGHCVLECGHSLEFLGISLHCLLVYIGVR